ncbi:MAG: hypothetical protein QW728_05675, partial [Thermoplasmata archaeon]
ANNGDKGYPLLTKIRAFLFIRNVEVLLTKAESFFSKYWWLFAAIFIIGLAGVVLLIVRRNILRAQGYLPTKEEREQEYMLSLYSAYADNVLTEMEEKVLLDLRKRLGFTQADHERLLAKVKEAGKLQFRPTVETSHKITFVRGQVLIDITLTNTTGHTVTSVSFNPVYREDEFYLSSAVVGGGPHVEGDKVKSSVPVGEIKPEESRRITLSFDPLVLKEAYIEGNLTFIDFRGIRRIEIVPKMKVMVKEPSLSPSGMSTAELIQFTRSLPEKDVRVFNLPPELTNQPAKAFDFAKELLAQSDLGHIRDIKREKPFRAETWFAGRDDSSREIILCGYIDSESKTFSITGYGYEQGMLIGLLGNLARRFGDILVQRGYAKQQIRQITNITIKDSILQRSTLLAAGDDALEDTEGERRVEIVDSQIIGSSVKGGAPEESSRSGTTSSTNTTIRDSVIAHSDIDKNAKMEGSVVVKSKTQK